ncbi:hypothetical protein JL720_12439 [Aureococcus anophagefferens]|nr:hypothetical protein JL720_12439 [Aureococcus anophagefferens]
MLQCKGTDRFKTEEALKKAAKKKDVKVRERGARGRLSAEPEPDEAAAPRRRRRGRRRWRRAAPAPAPAGAKKEVILVLDGAAPAEKLRLKIAIPATWASKPAAKLKQTPAKHATAKRPGAPVDANALVMVRDSGDKLRGDAPMDLLENGETITFRRKAAAAAAS